MASLTDDNTNTTSEICNYYKNKSVFITGATGFLGKVLIEKLLRTCNQLDKIYLLIRSKKGKQPSERIDEILDCKLFDIVKSLDSNIKNKLVVIDGDLTEPDLGISEKDRSLLIERIHIIFHSAATLKFDEPLKVAVNMNIAAVKKIVDLAKEMKNLEAFVHVSTAYANCNRSFVKEEVYDPPITAEKLLQTVDLLDTDLIDHLTPKLIQPRPNTYTFTKAIAESLIKTECVDIPCCIVRPSIIGASRSEPFPGWVDNFYGPSMLFAAIGTGLFRCMMGDDNAICDTVPVDTTVNCLIAASWSVGTKQFQPRNIIVYNCTSGQINQVKWGTLKNYCLSSINIYPFENVFLTPGFTLSKYKYVRSVKTFFLQTMPAYVADFFLRLSLQKPTFVRLQSKLTNLANLLEYFTQNEWKFTNENILMLMDRLNPIDKQNFNFDLRDINWFNYVENYSIGCKQHLMKEDLERLPNCRKRLNKIKTIQKIVLYGFLLLLFCFFMIRTDIGDEFFNISFD